jgi:starch synthase
MRVGLLTREYPPDVYGGAGVHVDFLARHLRGLVDLDVYCMGAERPGATAFAEQDGRFPQANPALQVLSTDLAMTAACSASDLVHSHTWYANMAGHLSSLLYDIPHVVSAHSLEPLRPWKAEQLGGGYRVSSWAERTSYLAAAAVVAVSQGMARDIQAAYPEVSDDRLHVIYNGIDADFYHHEADTDVVESLGIDLSRPYVTFVGRITRQKGVPHLLRAGLAFDPQVQILLLAGAADTPDLKAETDAAVETLQASRDGVIVVSEMLPRESVRQVLSHALAFLCPSVYEPLGIVNLEAMACETAVRMGAAGRLRAVKSFDWAAIAAETVDLYRSVI